MSFFAVTSSRPPAEESSKLPEVGIELRSEQKLEGLCDQLSTTTHRFETWARVREQSLHIDDSSQLLAVAKALFAEKWPNLLSQLEELPLDHLTRVCLDISSRMLHGDISKARFLDPGEPSIWEEVEYKIAICVIQPLLARLSERDVLALYAPMMEEYFLHILKFGDISRLEQIATFCRREFIESPETSGVAKERILSEFEQLGVNGKSLVQKLPVCANFATGKWDLRSDPELAAAAILTVERLLEWGICAPTFMYGVAELFGYQSYFESDSFYSAAATGIAEALEFHRATHAIKIHALVSSLMRESLSADEFTQKSQ